MHEAVPATSSFPVQIAPSQVDAGRQIAAMAGLGIWKWDCMSPTQTLEWDARCFELHGVTPRDFDPSLGAVLLLYDDASRSRLEESLMGAAMSAQSFQVEVNCPTPGGVLRRLQVMGTPQDGGRTMVGFYQDVTAREHQLRQLLTEQAQSKALLQALPDCLLALDANGYIRHAVSGPSAFAPGDIVGKHVAEAFPALRADFAREMKEALASEESRRLEFRQPVSLVERWLEARLVPLPGGFDPTRAALLLVRDVTEQHEHAQLLKLSEQAAQQASLMKTQFLANMSHEIRTPLNGVIGMVELLLGTDLPHEGRDYAQTAMQSAHNLLEIVNDILDLSKIEANRLDLEIITFSLRHVVSDALAAHALRAHEKGLELVGSVDPGIPVRQMGDPTRIRQVLNNLLSNAVKFTASGEVELQVTQREPGVVRVSVYDTGEGIRPEAQAGIFEAFTQADGSTTRRHGGTGLGLNICRELVELMGGRIWLESQPGQGSCFSFSLKLPTATEAEEPVAGGDSAYQAFVREMGSSRLTPDEFRLQIQSKKMLVVDDNASCRRGFRELLASWGVPCQVAVGPGPGLQMVRDAQQRGAPFDLVLLDMQMPGCSGLELAAEIPAGPHKVLLLTLGRPSVQEMDEAGVSQVMFKPVLGRDLGRLLLKAVGAGQEGAAPLAARTQRSLHVLMAEDNLINARVLTKMLQRLGHRVTHVGNGEQAVAFLQKERPDVVLMDVQMPVMDGFEATRRWRALEAGSNDRVPIVALTGNAMSSDRDRCLEVGMDLHLTKPIRLDLLDQMLSALPA